MRTLQDKAQESQGPPVLHGPYERRKRFSGADHPDLTAAARYGTAALYGDGAYPYFETECRVTHPPTRPSERDAPPLRNWPRPLYGGFTGHTFRFPAVAA